MSCLICLEDKKYFYNLCNACNNCFVCKNCYLSTELVLQKNCFVCRKEFTRVSRNTNLKDVWYFLVYFKHIYIYFFVVIFFSNMNAILYFPDKTYLENKTYLFQSIEIYLLFMNYFNLVLIPYLCNLFTSKYNFFFWSICLINAIFTFVFPLLDKKGQSFLHLYYNIIYMYILCILSSTVFNYFDLYDDFIKYIKTFNNDMKIIKSNIKIHNHYIKRSQISPLREHTL